MLSCKVDNFQSQLPYRPFATNNFQHGMTRMPRDSALKCDYIQLNPQTMRWAFVLDLDYETFPLVAEDVDLPDPTFFISNPKNGHAHLIYALTKPVCTSDKAHQMPILYLEAIEESYRQRLHGDPAYVGLIAKNPWKTNRWNVTSLCGNITYDLEYLADAVCDELCLYPASKLKEPESDRASLGRNCYIFEKVRLWCYKAIRNHWGADFFGWEDAVYAQCCKLNASLPDVLSLDPLPEREIRGIARGLARWVRKRFTIEGFSQWARHQSEKRWGPTKKTEAMELLKSGYSVSEIAQALNVSGASVRRWKREELDEMEVSIKEQHPWEQMGISRSYYYRLKKEGRLEDYLN